MKVLTLAEISQIVDGVLEGPKETIIKTLADIESAREGQITFVVKEKYMALFDNSQASAGIVPMNVEHSSKPIIRVKDPNLAAALVHNRLLEHEFVPTGISRDATIGSACTISKAVSIGARVVIGNGVRIGERVTIHPGVVIGDDVEIGDDTCIHPNVTIYFGCSIGNRVIIHAGTVIGSDGFGYAADSNGRHVKRPQVGTVQIDNDVELGANVCVDRATFGKTLIQSGTKIDNLVQIGHNVTLGENTIIVAQSGVSGSTRLGRNVVIGGQVGIAGHLEIGDFVMVGAKSGVHDDQPSKSVVSGVPAIPHRLWLRTASAVQKLPELIKDVREIKKKLFKSDNQESN